MKWFKWFRHREIYAAIDTAHPDIEMVTLTTTEDAKLRIVRGRHRPENVSPPFADLHKESTS